MDLNLICDLIESWDQGNGIVENRGKWNGFSQPSIKCENNW